MNSNPVQAHARRKPAVSPPKGLLASILAQAPLIAYCWPLAPSHWELWLGGALGLAAVVLNLWADQLFKQKGVAVCVFSPSPQLISKGPFKVTRNPMYLGFVFLSASFSLCSGVLLNLWAPLALFGWLHVQFVLPEEAFLREQLGETYEAYRSSHPRWIGINLISVAAAPSAGPPVSSRLHPAMRSPTDADGDD